MKTIKAEIVADSICNGHRLTTLLCTFPRFILPELNTHRMFSKNSASSRAIPFEKMVKMVEEDPFIFIAWQKDHKGMQGTEYFTDKINIEAKEGEWLIARNHAINQAKQLNDMGVTKQLCNRLLEPFMWHTCLITATEWENFFNLRCPKYYYEPENKYFRSKRDFLEYAENAFGSHIYIKDEEWRSINSSQAEIHIQALAESMWDALNESTPKELNPGEWHIPFDKNIDSDELAISIGFKTSDYDWYMEKMWSKIKIATARCARLSYMTFDGEIDYKKDIELHDRLLSSHHYSPFEHCARAMTQEEYSNFFKGYIDCYYDNLLDKEILEYVPKENYGWCNNFRGWIQYRYLIENE